jgi:hypothetical protein
MRHPNNFRLYAALAGVAFLAPLAFSQQQFALGVPESLFVPLGGGVDLSSAPAVDRWRSVGVRVGLLEDAAAHGGGLVTLNLFEDVELEASLESTSTTAGGGLVLSGRVVGEPESSVNIVSRGPTVAGTIRMGAELYRIGALPNGDHFVARIDESAFPTCATGEREQVGEALANEPIPMPEGFSSGEIADVLVMYSPEARAAVGGTTAIQNLIDLAVLETNQSYENSDVLMRLNLVHTAETAQNESGDFQNMLYQYRDQNDGWYDEVHALREQYEADLCALIVDNTQYCGIAFLMQTVDHSFESWAFSLTSWSCATGHYTFAHELGHNMGCHHDRNNASNSGAYPYSYGWRTPNQAWRTVMAYAPGTRIPYYSTPYKTYGGYPLGIAHPDPNSAHNARGLDEAAPVISRWRGGPGTAECFGDGGGMSCPCGNFGGSGEGCGNSTGVGCALTGNGSSSIGDGSLQLASSGALPGQPGLFFQGNNSLGNGVVFGDGLRCCGEGVVRLQVVSPNANGDAVTSVNLGLTGGVSPGDDKCYQFWYRDPVASPCGANFNLSNSYGVNWLP